MREVARVQSAASETSHDIDVNAVARAAAALSSSLPESLSSPFIGGPAAPLFVFCLLLCFPLCLLLCCAPSSLPILVLYLG
jgi:hypothetical protein